MTHAIITTVIHRVSNLFGDFESDRKSFRCRAMPANIPHRKCVVNTLKLKNFHLSLHFFLRSNDDFFGYYGGGFICMNDALNAPFFIYERNKHDEDIQILWTPLINNLFHSR